EGLILGGILARVVDGLAAALSRLRHGQPARKGPPAPGLSPLRLAAHPARRRRLARHMAGRLYRRRGSAAPLLAGPLSFHQHLHPAPHQQRAEGGGHGGHVLPGPGRGYGDPLLLARTLGGVDGTASAENESGLPAIGPGGLASAGAEGGIRTHTGVEPTAP